MKKYLLPFIFLLLCLSGMAVPTITLDFSHPGKEFLGMGGNFRLQNPRHDPKVIDYCINNLRVAYSRVEMPWKDWHSDASIDPMTAPLHPHVKASMEMAARLYRLGCPVILSCWFPPFWATTGEKAAHKWNTKAWQLDYSKKEAIFKSLADYMEYAQKHFGVIFALFSFNESDLGIDVFFTAEEHATFLKEFGQYLKQRHLSTKLLMGDNCNATTLDFIQPALNDPDTYNYIGAVAFHSWDGCTPKNLLQWKNAAWRINKPLLVTEGSSDAQAWRHSEVFLQPDYAMKEVNLYLDIFNLCQPQSILQWQYTSDYSLMAGEGLCNDKGPLRPTQRFWCQRQLSFTPEGVFYIPTKSSEPSLNCAAFADKKGRSLAMHITNNGNECTVTIPDLPKKTRPLKVYITDATHGMESHPFTLSGKTLTIKIPAKSFISILTQKD